MKKITFVLFVVMAIFLCNCTQRDNNSTTESVSYNIESHTLKFSWEKLMLIVDIISPKITNKKINREYFKEEYNEVVFSGKNFWITVVINDSLSNSLLENPELIKKIKTRWLEVKLPFDSQNLPYNYNRMFGFPNIDSCYMSVVCVPRKKLIYGRVYFGGSEINYGSSNFNVKTALANVVNGVGEYSHGSEDDMLALCLEDMWELAKRLK